MSCKHSETEMRLRVIAGGNKAIYVQCKTCGACCSNAIKRADLPPERYAGLPAFDDTLTERYAQKQKEHSRHNPLDEKQSWSADRKAKYASYLASPRWRAKREAVMERDAHVCQACLQDGATEVHHLTYAHIFDEPLFDLVAICAPCHRRIHGLDYEEIEQ